jgi:hypothetical protein
VGGFFQPIFFALVFFGDNWLLLQSVSLEKSFLPDLSVWALTRFPPCQGGAVKFGGWVLPGCLL